MFDAFDNDKAKKIVIETAMDINEDYLTSIFLGDYDRAPFLDYQKPESLGVSASRTTLARHTAKEIVTGAFGRFILGGEEWPKNPRSPYAQTLIERLATITLKPTILPQPGEDTVLSTMEIPIALPEALSRVIHRNKTQSPAPIGGR